MFFVFDNYWIWHPRYSCYGLKVNGIRSQSSVQSSMDSKVSIYIFYSFEFIQICKEYKFLTYIQSEHRDMHTNAETELSIRTIKRTTCSCSNLHVQLKLVHCHFPSHFTFLLPFVVYFLTWMSNRLAAAAMSLPLSWRCSGACTSCKWHFIFLIMPILSQSKKS